jgi:hypothetical protein
MKNVLLKEKKKSINDWNFNNKDKSWEKTKCVKQSRLENIMCYNGNLLYEFYKTPFCHTRF